MCLAHFIFSVRRTQARTRNIFLFSCQVKRTERISVEHSLDLSWKKSQSQLKNLFLHMQFSIPLVFSFPSNIFAKFLVFTILFRNAHFSVWITIKNNVVTISLSLCTLKPFQHNLAFSLGNTSPVVSFSLRLGTCEGVLACMAPIWFPKLLFVHELAANGIMRTSHSII